MSYFFRSSGLSILLILLLLLKIAKGDDIGPFIHALNLLRNKLVHVWDKLIWSISIMNNREAWFKSNKWYLQYCERIVSERWYWYVDSGGFWWCIIMIVIIYILSTSQQVTWKIPKVKLMRHVFAQSLNDINIIV